MRRVLSILAGVFCLFSLLHTHSVTAAEPTWRRLAPTMPDSVLLAYDRTRGVLVCFARHFVWPPGEQVIELWEWDDRGWRKREPSGPVPAGGRAMTYDAARDETVLFGEGETWTWDGRRWTLRSTTGPHVGGRSGMTYDRRRKAVILLGGGEMWEWNGQSWTLRSANSPTTNSDERTAIAYDSVRDRIVFFRTLPSETWEWDGDDWKLIADSNSGANVPVVDRYGFAFDEQRGVTVLVGMMFTRWSEIATWTWDGKNWSEVAQGGGDPIPPAQLVYDSTRGVILSHSTHLAEWDGERWTPRDPGPRKNHQMVYDQARHEVVLYGGIRGNYPGPYVLDDTWALAPRGWVRKATDGPGPRSSHAMAYDERRERVILVGGYDDSGAWRSDTWQWDGTQWTQIATAGPTRGEHVSMAYDPIRDVTVLTVDDPFADPEPISETWEWTDEKWNLIERMTGNDRAYQNLIFDNRTGTVLSYTPQSTAVRQWNGARWDEVSSAGPWIVDVFPMAYDKARGSIVAFGRAYQEAYTARTWEWDGATWSGREFALPGDLRRGAMTYDVNRHRIVMQGGEANHVVADAWVYDVNTPGDADFDGDVDAADFSVFVQCFGGADVPPAPGCPDGIIADLDADGDVDMADFAEFSLAFTGAR